MGVLLKPAQVADLLGVHVRTVQIWARRGVFGPCAVRVGSAWRFNPDALQDWLKEREMSGTPPIQSRCHGTA